MAKDFDDDAIAELAQRLSSWSENSPDPDFFQGGILAAILADCGEASQALYQKRLQRRCGACGQIIRADPMTGTACACSTSQGSMDIIGAMRETVKHSCPDGNVSGIESLQTHHLNEMLEKMEAGGFSYGKLCRWLGWAQAAVVANGDADLDTMKAINRRFQGSASLPDTGDPIRIRCATQNQISELKASARRAIDAGEEMIKTLREERDEARAAIATTQAEVKIKPLEWEYASGYSVLTYLADCLVGRYTVNPLGAVYLNGKLIASAPSSLSLEAAKAAAQADFETRIRSSLIPAMVAGEGENDIERLFEIAKAIDKLGWHNSAHQISNAAYTIMSLRKREKQ